MDLTYVAIFSFLSVGAIAVFSMISVSIYTTQRRREREAFYRNETLKKLAEFQGAGAQAVLEVMREQERITWGRVREGVKLGGLAAMGAGLGLLALFWGLHHERPAGFVPLFVGAIPFFIGAGLLIYGLFLGPREGH